MSEREWLEGLRFEDLPELTAPGPCAACGKNPAVGFASINGEWYCHGDWEPDPTCYMRGKRPNPEGVPF
jgi:hypothetical protein